MDRQQAQNIIKETFENSFEKVRFAGFISNLLNSIEEAPFSYKGNFIPDAYEQYISSLERLGKYTSGDHKLDILIVKLKKKTSIERARTMQRNFIAWYLNGSRGGELKDAALVAFVSPNEEDWRFSLVKMDYRFEAGKDGRIKIKEEFTPARRWSFLVGENENSHTAQQQLLPILQNDRIKPTYSELETAFDIESVTREFFEQYKKLFLKLKEELDKLVAYDASINADFTDKQIDTADFAKKLLGQIVFLYFLQKKGWLGANRDDNGKFQLWGTGPKNFLRKLFDKGIVNYENFFNDILEPLFYEALALPRENDFYSRFNCKIPFLNGGLFEPISGYNWQETDICLRNETFAEVLDTFDLYNFTVKEDEPLEKEVAVDPEMLGKVFENLLEVKDRKSKGTYYTPREIVHYMCQGTLISYLDFALNGNKDTVSFEQLNLSEDKTHVLVPRADIESFIRYGEFTVENDKRVVSKGRETKTYLFQLSDTIRNNAALIDEALGSIKVCDPAIGSGAFPVGIMHEIIKARETLTTHLRQDKQRTRYNFKRHAIQESIYGVDIDPSAVEIAKLRLWLSLVVDEDDYHSIKPLPNLDYKIMQGNSLFEEYEGNKLFDENLIISTYSENEEDIKAVKERLSTLQKEYIQGHQKDGITRVEKQKLKAEIGKQTSVLNNLLEKETPYPQRIELFAYESAAFKISNELRMLHMNIFEVSERKKKDTLRKQIEELEWQLIEATLKEQNKETSLSAIQHFKKSSHKPFFIWKLHFSEVFQEKGGFDVVIANPPYIQSRDEMFSDQEKESLYNSYETAEYQLNTYGLFIEKGFKLLRKNGHMAYIIPNYWLSTKYDKALRDFVFKKNSILELVNVYKVFENATVDTLLLIGRHIVGTYPKSFIVKSVSRDSISIQDRVKALDTGIWGYCKKIIVDSPTEDVLVSFSDSLSLKGEYKLTDFFVFKKGMQPYELGKGIPLQTKEMMKDKIYDAKIQHDSSWQPLIKARNVKHYRLDWHGDWIKYGQNLAAQRDPELFKGPRILIQRIVSSNKLSGVYTDKPFICNTDVITLKPKDISDKSDIFYFLGILLSSLCAAYLKSRNVNLDRAAFPKINVNTLESFPTPIATDAQKPPIIKRVQAILANPDSPDVPRLEAEINKLVYALYGLTPKEIAIVEGKG